MSDVVDDHGIDKCDSGLVEYKDKQIFLMLSRLISNKDNLDRLKESSLMASYEELLKMFCTTYRTVRRWLNNYVKSRWSCGDGAGVCPPVLCQCLSVCLSVCLCVSLRLLCYLHLSRNWILLLRFSPLTPL